jgi:hypothetical protein
MYDIPCWDRSQRGRGRRASAWVRFAPAFRSDSAAGRAASLHTCHTVETIFSIVKWGNVVTARVISFGNLFGLLFNVHKKNLARDPFEDSIASSTSVAYL